MKNGIDPQRYYLDAAGGRQVFDYSSNQRSLKRMSGEETSDFLYFDRRSVKKRRREEEEIINYRRRRQEEDINYGRSSNRRRTEESRRDISLNIDYGRSSYRRRKREESGARREDINYGRSSYKRRRREEEREDRRDVSLLEINNYGRSSYSNRRKRVDDDITFTLHLSGFSCLDRSLIKEGERDAVSIKFYEEDDDKTNATPVGTFPCFVDDGIVIEILSRLPTKSLLRFKSVCKHWLSLITQDQHFIHLHSIRSKSRPNLLWIAPKPQKEDTETLTQGILSAKLSSVTTTGGEAKVIIHNFKKTTDDNWFNYDYLLGPVNGLVCFIHWKTAAARIYNVSTRKVTPWIKSTLLAEEKHKFESEDNPLKLVSNFLPIYQFGFDPEKKEHKLFCFWRLSATDDSPFTRFYSDSDSGYASWEAFTVGRDTEWRRISVVPDENNLIKIKEVLPPYCRGKKFVHANGTIYWRNKLMNFVEDLDDPLCLRDYVPSDPDVIIGFDVGSEKFRVIPIPSFILDDPREKMFKRPIAMLILGGRVTLIYALSSSILKLLMLDDGVEKKLENCQGKGSSNWSTETITLPYDFDTGCLRFDGVPTSSDKILISVLIPTYGVIGGGIHKKMSCLYSYDRKTKTLEEIEMDGIFSIPPLHCNRSLFTTYTESLVPVLPQQGRSR
ncbi:F-box/kelch-repeat protein At4g19930-like isoform X3 [Papaver somniferum]|uniref:F-box/kelch-repeat protein At4g19930-like isoform X2 n=1 Tax=Papaver somniferum TaxID=3469 RepID=UPI000E6F7843|nr:F-box/kelch-repeat protein At4g19930-like isoform X2 [Papaver somniferum]XP_026445382.1 F-box/kelch-repeat protein At4g19930-like isoform X3 [Papaver somniferum]